MSDDPRRFDRPEFEARLSRLRAVMRQRGAEAALIDDCEILAYYTGYEASLSFYRACLVPLEGEPFMVLRALDAGPFLQRAWFSGHRGFADTEDAVEIVAQEIASHGWSGAAIALDLKSHAMTVHTFHRLRALLPEARFVNLDGLPWEQRLVKSPAEIAMIARAAGIADRTMQEIVDRLRPGMGERDVAAYAAGRFIELGGESDKTGPITSGAGWDHLHGHMHDGPLAPGSVLHMELVPRFAGYSARLMRCVAIGGATEAQRDASATLFSLQDAQIAAMRPGARADAVDRILRDGVVAAGLRETYRNITGYTLGFYSRQPLRTSDFTRVFHPAATWELEAGMVFHMYASARGLACSETVHVTADGPRRLTQTARRLFEVAS